MKIIIAGSRNMPDTAYDLIQQAVTYSGFQITEVVCGLARGADTLGAQWAEEHNIPVKEFPANWTLYGNKAGPIRNAKMCRYADGLIVFIWNQSRGSINMLRQIRTDAKPHAVYFNGKPQTLWLPRQGLF